MSLARDVRAGFAKRPSSAAAEVLLRRARLGGLRGARGAAVVPDHASRDAPAPRGPRRPSRARSRTASASSSWVGQRGEARARRRGAARAPDEAATCTSSTSRRRRCRPRSCASRNTPGRRRRAIARPTSRASTRRCAPRSGRRPGLVLFLGSNIGNFDPRRARRLLRRSVRALRPGDALLLGADLVKPERVLADAYDDPLGLTAVFNLNLLLRLNRELGGGLRPCARGGTGRAWNAEKRRVEMHLVSLRRQRVRIPERASPSRSGRARRSTRRARTSTALSTSTGSPGPRDSAPSAGGLTGLPDSP